MADHDCIDELIALGTDPRSIARIQERAKDLVYATGNGRTLRLACAATLSCFLDAAGIKVAPTVGAGRLARRLEKTRQWQRVPVGRQTAGDVGVTRDSDPSRPGADHVYLVVAVLDDDLMFIADNQRVGRRHHRSASGKKSGDMASARTPTEYFLRAPGIVAFLADRTDGDDVPDLDTNALREPYDDAGILAAVTTPT